MLSVAMAEGGEEERRRALKTEWRSASTGCQTSAGSKSRERSSTIISEDREEEEAGRGREGGRGERWGRREGGGGVREGLVG